MNSTKYVSKYSLSSSLVKKYLILCPQNTKNKYLNETREKKPKCNRYWKKLNKSK